MKKKEWYELLEEYNRLVEEKIFNENMVEPDDYNIIREKILKYLKPAYEKAEFDTNISMCYLSNEKSNPRLVAYKRSKLQSVIWMEKADKIIVSLEAHQLIDKEDIVNSYYGTSNLRNISEVLSLMALLVTPLVVYILFLLLY